MTALRTSRQIQRLFRFMLSSLLPPSDDELPRAIASLDQLRLPESLNSGREAGSNCT